MKKKNFNIYPWIAVGVFASVLGLTAVESVDRLFSSPLGRAPVAQAAAATDVRGLPDFVSLAKKLTPVVVNVSTTQALPQRQGPGSDL